MIEHTVKLHPPTEQPEHDDKVVLRVQRAGETETRIRLGRFRNGKWCIENAEDVTIVFWFEVPE